VTIVQQASGIIYVPRPLLLLMRSSGFQVIGLSVTKEEKEDLKGIVHVVTIYLI
jgi:hypothetical protein